MRPAASFTLHAILAACLAALAASSAAAGGPLIDNESKVFLQFRLGTSASDNRGQHIEIVSYSFGNGTAAHVNKVEALTIKQKATGETAGHGGGQGSGKVVVHDISTNSATAQAKERQAGQKDMIAEQHKEPAGMGPGTIELRGTLPGCRAGAAYPAAVLRSSSKQYELADVTVIGCGAGSISLRYGKVTVKGWNPEKKEL